MDSASPRRVRSDKRRRTRRLHIRLTEEEFQHALEQAALAGLRPTKLARYLLLDCELKPAKRLPDEVYRATMSFGNNLNQLARAMNTRPFDCQEELKGLRSEALQILSCLQQN
jgi:hypothetical protein